MTFSQYNHSNWYPEDRPKPDFKPSNRYATLIWLGIVVLILGAILGSLALISAGRKIGCMLSNCRSNPTAPALSWSDQFAVGQTVALKIDQDAALETVYLEPFASWPQEWTVSDTLKLTLTYLVGSGNRFDIVYDDATQGSTPEQLTTPGNFAGVVSKQDYKTLHGSQKHTHDINAIKISPRDAELATWKQGMDEAKKDQVNISTSISLIIHDEDDSMHPAWQVVYWQVPKDNPPDIADRLAARFGQDFSSEFIVDAVTGEIIGTDLGALLIKR